MNINDYALIGARKVIDDATLKMRKIRAVAALPDLPNSVYFELHNMMHELDRQIVAADIFIDTGKVQ